MHPSKFTTTHKVRNLPQKLKCPTKYEERSPTKLEEDTPEQCDRFTSKKQRCYYKASKSNQEKDATQHA